MKTNTSADYRRILLQLSVMPKDKKPPHIYKKLKDGFLVDSIDPIQDIMSEEELNLAQNRILSLIEADEDTGLASNQSDSKRH